MIWAISIILILIVCTAVIVYVIKSQDEDILDTLNKCEVVETQNSKYGNVQSIDCNLVCGDLGKVCIEQDYGAYSSGGWIFDSGGDCSTSYGRINNVNEEGGVKLHCTCC
jgi:hypothetical protein